MLNLTPANANRFRQAILEAVNALDSRLYEHIQDVQQEFNLDNSKIDLLSAIIGSFTHHGSLLLPDEPVQERLDYFNERIDAIVNQTEDL
jgi:hypothetical protein